MESTREGLRQPRHNPASFHAHLHHLTHQANDVPRVVGPVWFGLDGPALVLAHLVLVDDPFQGAAVAEVEIESSRANSCKVSNG